MKLTKEKLFSILKNPKMWKNTDIVADCPWCNNHEFYISLNDDHPFNCVRKKKCGETGNIYKLLEKLEVYDFLNLKESVSFNSKVNETLQIELSEEKDISIKECKLPLGFRRIYDDKYLRERGFSDQDFHEYFVGETKLDNKLLNYIIFCVYQEHRLVATIGRYKLSKSEIEKLEKSKKIKIPRYKNSDSEFSKILGNYDKIIKGETKTVILVEGLFDAKKIEKLLNLQNNETTKCCFTFKCHISEDQLERLKLKEIENLILLFDPDVIGKIKEQAIILANDFNVKVGYWEYSTLEGSLKDPDNLSLEELTTILDSLYTPLDFYTKKVQILNL